MLNIKCINPEIINGLALCGHGDKVLIADGNYPLGSKTCGAKKIYLGLMPGLPTVTQVLEALLSACRVEAAAVMSPDDGSEPEIFAQFQTALDGLEAEQLGRYQFYDACCSPDVKLALSTGETRTFANILLTIGCAPGE